MAGRTRRKMCQVCSPPYPMFCSRNSHGTATVWIRSSDIWSACSSKKWSRLGDKLPHRSVWFFSKCSCCLSDDSGETLWPHTVQMG